MTQRVKVLWVALALFMATGVSLAQAPQVGAVADNPVARVPPEAFFKRPDVSDAQLSPSGKFLAISTGLGGPRRGLIVFDLDKPGLVTQAARYNDADVSGFQWVSDERLVYSLTDDERGGGDQWFNPGLFSVRPDGTERRTLIEMARRFVTGTQLHSRALDWRHRLLHVPGNGGEDVIVGAYQFTAGGDIKSIDALRVNVVTGLVRSLSAGAPINVVRWLFDRQGEPRAVVSQRDGEDQFHWRAPGSTAWEQLAQFPTLRRLYSPAYVDDSGGLYVTRASGAAGLQVLARFDFAQRRPAREPLISTPGFDYRGSLLTEDVGGKVLGVRVETDAESTVWFDPAMKQMQALADKRLPGYVNRLSCRRCGQSDMVVLVRSYNDRDPGQLWVVRKATDTWQLISRVLSGIDPARMATVDFVRIKARDGRDLPVWLTIPPGRKAGAPGPAVVMVHGGPWVRGGHWAWQSQEQFLASRGYVVISPEFRGSTGYGRAHFEAGWKEWGQAMQDDVADAAKWAVAQGWAGKMCIAGASYGGYSTLMGLVRDPDLFQCGAAWVAVTDPFLYLKGSWWSRDDISDEGRKYSLPQMVGDAEKDVVALTAASPVAQASRITQPLFLAFGGSDLRVPLEHGTRLREALRKAGQEPEWVVYPGEGHGWNKLETQVDFARRLEKFLDQHLR